MSEQAKPERNKPERNNRERRITRIQQFIRGIGAVGLVWGGMQLVQAMGEYTASNEIERQLEADDVGNEEVMMIVDTAHDNADERRNNGITALAVGTGALFVYERLRKQHSANEQLLQ